MNKKIFLITAVVVVVVAAIVLLVATRSKCSSYNFAALGGQDCKCIGIKTDGCPPGAMCDKGIGYCYGIRTSVLAITGVTQPGC